MLILLLAELFSLSICDASRDHMYKRNRSEEASRRHTVLITCQEKSVPMMVTIGLYSHQTAEVHAVNNKKIALYQLSASYYVDTVSSGLKIQIAMVKYLLSVAKILSIRSRDYPCA